MLNTSVYLLKVPFSIDGMHQPFGFEKTARGQSSYFKNNYLQSTLVSRVLLDPNDGYFLAQTSYETAIKSNYMMFVNPSYGGKYFYAYIVDIKPRAGNETVEIHYVIDSVQTYMFEWLNNIKESQVYREHIGKDYKNWVDNTLSEDIPTGKLETIKVYEDIESKDSKYNEDRLKPLIRWAVFVSTVQPTELDIIDELRNINPNFSGGTSEGGGGAGGGGAFRTIEEPMPLSRIFIPPVMINPPGSNGHPMTLDKPKKPTTYSSFGYKAKSNKLAQTLNYYVVPIRMDMGNNGGDIFINNRRAATIEEISEFFSEDILAVNSLIRVIIKNDIPIKTLGIEKQRNGNININLESVTGANLVNIGGRTLGKDVEVDSWWNRLKDLQMYLSESIFGSKDLENKTQLIKSNTTVAGDVLILDDSLELDTDGTVMVQVNDIFKDIHSSEPRLRFPPFTRYYIETENGSEKEFDVTKLNNGEAVLKYRTNLGPLDSSILSLDNFNNRNKKYNGNLNNLQYEHFLQYSSEMSIPIQTNQSASLLQSQQNQLTANLNASLLDAGIGMVSGTAGVALGAALGPAGYGMMGEGANTIAKSAVGLYKENAAHEAQMNDTKNRPNAVGQIGMDISYNLLNKRASNLIKVKTVSSAYERLVMDYIKKNGQQIMRLKKPNLNSRNNWNYIQCDLNIAGASIPQIHINKIKDTFLNGTTLWHTSDIYNYSKDNLMK